MVKNTLYITLILLLFACSAREQKETVEQPELVEKYFPNFPAQQFLDIELGQSTQVVREKLKGHQYEPINQQEQHYENLATHSEVIISEGEELNELKVFLLDPTDIQKRKQIQQLLKENAQESNESDAYSTYLIESSKNTFKSTLFMQDDLIRIVFQLKN